GLVVGNDNMRRTGVSRHAVTVHPEKACSVPPRRAAYKRRMRSGLGRNTCDTGPPRLSIGATTRPTSAHCRNPCLARSSRGEAMGERTDWTKYRCRGKSWVLSVFMQIYELFR